MTGDPWVYEVTIPAAESQRFVVVMMENGWGDAFEVLEEGGDA